MSLSRRDVLLAGASAPLLAACATDLTRYSGETLPALAARLDVCAASHVTLNAGRPDTPVLLSGCPSARPLPSDPVFQAASLTKPVIAFAALKLVRDGRLDLRAPVSRFLPTGYDHRQRPFNGPNDNPIDRVPASTLARIPLGTLLNHSSGLPNWARGTLSPEFEPGTRWRYSGEGYVLLQAVLSAVAGQDIETFMSTTVFEPLGMRATRLRFTDDIRERVLDGTSSFGGRVRFDIREPNAAASLYTTTEDYARLVAALLADATLRALTVAHPIAVDEALGLAWGQGWGIETAAGGPYLWQWGNNPGFRAFAMVSLASGNGFVLFTNSERGMPLAVPLARATIPSDHGVFRFHMLG
jgi:CubicO group peptidase (beta-lactamase class C family)